ncbi:MAG TPA: DUF389 domain-containing protein [Ignavibacteria bacterium]|nr:hypothetical protein [Bacteroidota bacterium]HRI84040.1 DUF389 domain-containing protein [Ignavibacteria bacterium]HRJ99546.1 DUF389 domain-containing protein [Ignavibacteria bacterium]
MYNKILDFINLQTGEENKQKTLENVISNISFRGANLWILACAIVIASIGLNVNSTAVIIGAMLISPLMGPIVGAGFALGTYDFQLLKKSFKNLFIATLVGLFVSAFYFYISPFKETQSELLARTSPNIYDVLIAFFGGLVGVIAITRVEKGNPIPGVAIATALMPPLCTAGYGIAIGNFQYFLGSFYLYTINSFFICIATFLIIKYLKYEPVNTIQNKQERLIRYSISILILIMIVPSFFLARNLLNEKKFSQNVEKFIANEFSNKGYTVIYKKTSYNSNPKKIDLAFLSKKFSDEEIDTLNSKLFEYEIQNTKLNIKQDVTDLKSEILNEIGNQNKNITEKDLTINNLQNELSEFKFDNTNIIRELQILFPEMKNVSIGKHMIYQNTDSAKYQTVLIYGSEKSLSNNEIEKLNQWLTQKLETADVKVVRMD